VIGRRPSGQSQLAASRLSKHTEGFPFSFPQTPPRSVPLAVGRRAPPRAAVLRRPGLQTRLRPLWRPRGLCCRSVMHYSCHTDVAALKWQELHGTYSITIVTWQSRCCHGNFSDTEHFMMCRERDGKRSPQDYK